MINIPHYIESRKDRYMRLPGFIRSIIVAISFAAGAAGAIFALLPPPFFDIGVILLLLSLSILSFQFRWAQTTLLYIDKKLHDKAFRKKLIIFGVCMFFVVAGIIVLKVVT